MRNKKKVENNLILRINRIDAIKLVDYIKGFHFTFDFNGTTKEYIKSLKNGDQIFNFCGIIYILKKDK